MGQVLHGSATTTEAVRRVIQHSQESLRTLSKRFGINPKTVAKWKGRDTVADQPTGPREPRSTVLSAEEEAIIVAFRRHTLLPLDDCLYALQPTIPSLTRSSLHRCLQRHGLGRLPEVEGDKPKRKRFKAYPLGYFHIDIAEVRTEEGKLHLFVAIDRTSKFAFVELHERATTRISADFLRRLILWLGRRVVDELGAVIRQHGVDGVGHRGNEGVQEIGGDAAGSPGVQLGEGELGGAVDGNEEVELAFLGPHLGDVDVEVADRVGLEVLAPGLVSVDVGQPGDSMPLQAAMQA